MAVVQRDPLSLRAHPAHLRSGDNPQAFLLEDLGQRLSNFRLVAGGEFRETELVDALTKTRYPARNIPELLLTSTLP